MAPIALGVNIELLFTLVFGLGAAFVACCSPLARDPASDRTSRCFTARSRAAAAAVAATRGPRSWPPR